MNYKYFLNFRFFHTEEEAAAFCARRNAKSTRYIRERKPAHYTPWESRDGSDPAHFIAWFYA